MADGPDKDEKTESPTDKRRRDAAEKGDVLQSKELGTALVIVAGAAWIALAGHALVGALEEMLAQGLSFGPEAVRDFDPAAATLRLAMAIAVPVLALFAMTLIAAIAAPALLGSLGFRAKAFGFKPDKMNPLSGLKRVFGVNGLIELVKSIAKVILLGAIGAWLLRDQSHLLIGLSSQEIRPALSSVGSSFVLAILVMSMALALVAGIDVPAQIFQRAARLRMSKQEVKEEHKQTEGSPELKAAVRRRQHEVLRGSARSAVAEATVILTNPTHFAVALRYRPGEDAAPIVVARGRGATADAIRALAGESDVPILSYPQLARALYFTARTGQVIRDDLYMAVATVLAFVFNLDAALAAGTVPPPIDVPPGARFDEKGRPQA
ncbi:EscU/YscU/HrcU family type III secretion system export apparatus switch protein [Allosphingosinicella deserti]|uniref:Flagellar biosynthesis protein FlhB n=1 Tax=Allosphingosinicella deserti TaxID=2116704 RepID=A0A2P7QP03_9SPHN|nr:flagellar type III secretion system protein FlhB [Sphingomonas deserti]PSJ39684.1 flagellar biosynthesis protein FlhB [Sphingomonas deserti]